MHEYDARMEPLRESLDTLFGDDDRISTFYQPTVKFFADTEGAVFSKVGEWLAENPGFAVLTVHWEISDAEATIDDPDRTSYSLTIAVEPE